MNQPDAKQIVVAGHLIVDPAGRAAYLADCREVVRQARLAAGCLDFAISADLLDPGRINIFERWESRKRRRNVPGQRAQRRPERGHRLGVGGRIRRRPSKIAGRPIDN